MIKTLVWNIKGIINGLSIRRLKKILISNKIKCSAIFKCSKGTIKGFEMKLNYPITASNEEGSIWLSWKQEIRCTVTDSTSQYISVLADLQGLNFAITFVYASCDSNKRKLLWEELSTFNFNWPWMLARDFNCVTSQDDKCGGNPINLNEVNGFNIMISNLGSTDSGYSGNKFT